MTVKVAGGKKVLCSYMLKGFEWKMRNITFNVDVYLMPLVGNDMGVIQTINSAFASPVVLVKKKDGGWWMCVDYRSLNKSIILDIFMIPMMEELLDKLHEWNTHAVVWRNKADLETMSMDNLYNKLKGNPQQKEYKEKGVIDNGCSRHMIGNKCYLSDNEDYDGGFVSIKDGKGRISSKGKIKTRTLDFNDVYFCKELKYNLFSVSQMCDKKKNVLFTDIECLVLSSNFKLLDESQVLLRVPRKDNIYSVDLKCVVPTKGLTYLFAKAIIDESKLWPRRLGHINYKTMSKIVRGNLVGDQADDLNEVVDSAQQSIPKETLYDPFNIYDILKKENKDVNAAATNSSIPFPPGFTPDKPDTDVGEPVARKDQFQPDLKSVGSSSHTLESANNVDD
nr:ribonuclease H-like domain-containing protein [Tanacetum cinerariifolium]